MRRPSNTAAKINIADRSPAWTGTGCYVSPVPVQISDQYNRMTGDYERTRQHLFYQPDGTVVRCKPNLCRECGREADWHDHGGIDA